MDIQKEINSVVDISDRYELIDLQDNLQGVLDFYVENSYYFPHVPVVIFIRARIEEALEFKSDFDKLNNLVGQSGRYLEKLKNDLSTSKKCIDNEDARKKRIAKAKKEALSKDKAKDKFDSVRG